MKISNFIICTIILYFSIWELEGKPSVKYNNVFGVKGSNISGYGLCYQRRINDLIHIEVVGIVYLYQWHDENKDHEIFNYSAGVELQYNIKKEDFYRLYLLAGGYYDNDDDKRDEKRIEKEKNSYNSGFGAGIEFFYKRIVYNLELGYKFYEDNSEVSKDGGKKFPELERVAKPDAEIGIGFLF